VERFGYLVGALLLASGLIHLAILLVGGGSWQGPLSLRKPTAFGLSFGLTVVTIVWVASFLRLGERTRVALLTAFTIASDIIGSSCRYVQGRTPQFTWVTRRYNRRSMRYAMFSTADDPVARLGVIHNDRIADVQKWLADSGSIPRTVLELIQSGPDAWRRTAERLSAQFSGKPLARSHSPADVRWHAPIPRPLKNIVCLGLNYASHVRETTRPDKEMKVPDLPVFFTKASTSASGPYDPIPWDRSATTQVDYEAELGVIVGAGGKNIRRDHALDHVFGYTVINDVSARDLQFGHKQWFKGKSLDGFCPMGPVIVTADEYGDPQKQRITLRVNGETRQDATTGDMIFPVNVILEYLSQGMTVEPGDIIATGTPEGVGLGRTPPEYLKDGDVVETEIEGIGMLRNQLRIAGDNLPASRL
jgi:2-keto-4-pentenoate hydratase/2-oxohepta-3-ene-1,7-dioic acid hydratase in catechol pathway